MDANKYIFILAVVLSNRYLLYRTGSQVAAWNESWAKRLYFGVNVLHEQRGVLRVGDGVDVLRVAKKMPLDAKKTD